MENSYSISWIFNAKVSTTAFANDKQKTTRRHKDDAFQVAEFAAEINFPLENAPHQIAAVFRRFMCVMDHVFKSLVLKERHE